MGREAKTEYADARERVHVRAHLDTQAVGLSGGKKLTVPFAAIRAATVEGDDLKIVAAGARFALRLGAKEAALWAKKILNPPSLADKLGIKADKRVVLIGAVPAEVTDAAKTAKVTTAAKPPKAFAADIAIVMLAPGKEEALIAAAAGALQQGRAVWFVYEKGRAVNGDDIIALARKAGLKDTKVARVSDTHAALRFISGK
jgi:hypothetical protein